MEDPGPLPAGELARNAQHCFGFYVSLAGCHERKRVRPVRIDPELLPRLFDRFVRADSARGRDTGGAGLGLAICRSIVEEHGGRIRAENAETGGARFVIELPVSAQRLMRPVSSLSHA